MLNLSIFIKSLNPDADYHRQQVSERGILEQIDNLNESLLKIEGMEPKLINEFYKVLDTIETSLTLNVNDPRTRMALMSFKPEPEKKSVKEPEKKLVMDTEKGLKNPDTENAETQEPTVEPTGEPVPAEKVDTTESTSEPTSKPDPAEKVDITEPTDESTGESAGESTDEAPEPTTETAE